MSGAVMLLIAATVGITYGWAPDGGNGVKYIIQIPPDKVEQVARSGEISSQIPDEIRSHVTEVVIRVGHGNLPRITPSHLVAHCPPAPARNGAIAAADFTPIPIPSMGEPSDLLPIGSRSAPANAMMKPSPQSGGMNLPGSSRAPAPSTSSAGPSTNFGQAARETANNIANDVRGSVDAGRQQVQQNIEESAQQLGDAANRQMQSTVDNARGAAAQLFSPRASTHTPDDPRSRLVQDENEQTQRPSTAPYARSSPTQNSNEPSRSNEPPRSNGESRSREETNAPPPFATSRANTSTPPSGPQNGYAQSSQNRSGDPQSASPQRSQEDDWYDLRNGSRRRPSTAPLDTNNTTPPSNRFGGGNFGRLPDGLDTDSSPSRRNQSGDRNEYADASGPENASRESNERSPAEYDRNLTPAQAARLPRNGYSFDAENHPVDREGYRLDGYGRRVDRQGRLLAAVDNIGRARDDRRNPSGSGAPPNYQPPGSQPSNRYADNGYAGNNPPTGNRPPLVQPPMAPQPTQPPMAPQPPNQNQAGGYPPAPRRPNQPPQGQSPMLGAGMPGYNQYADSRATGSSGPSSRPGAGEDSARSASDQTERSRRSEERRTAFGGATEEAAGSPEQVAAQPIFNALLLLSIVANVYLLFWLKNLRLQFRDMVASNRASTSGHSLATSG